MASSAQNSWSILLTGESSGAYNMALDYALSVSTNDRSVLRLYEWNPRSISIGHHQSSGTVNKSLCMDLGVDFVRRPTGGRAILHSEEITYSVIMPGSGYGFGELYLKVHSAIGKAMARLGINVDLVRTSPLRNSMSPGSRKSTCFVSSAKTELEFNGKKIVGSAGRRYGNAILLHGSILLGDGHKAITDFLDLSAAQTDEMKKELSDKTTNLSEAAGRKVSASELVSPMQKEFSAEFDMELEETALSDELNSQVESLENRFNMMAQREEVEAI